ncbi:MAG: lasso RiPP family leader peptide-containing protein [Xanthomonadales bacterium]|nr:lasso RiPP family leader peptide-containing protein [Xanthomonadales bacterium]
MVDTQRSHSKDPQELLQYEAPVLRLLGDVRQLTLGGSPGSGDSGNPGEQNF